MVSLVDTRALAYGIIMLLKGYIMIWSTDMNAEGVGVCMFWGIWSSTERFVIGLLCFYCR